ncbi:glycosyltransferase [Planococcus sp. S3-L1]|uniref:glycosyltransferase family 2 protein n=1 Tax=Planococcus sp. S3-L1 TaxID=3046200 RepID=UPI0024BA22D1|nr:glycosyltransferase [Planococcus sp. S3-L1]MDJ0332941.1 glycosyltransferase [Planococcus sp. S3-L1]
MNLFVERFFAIVAIIFITYMFLYTTFLFLSVLVGAVRLQEKDQLVRLKNEIKHDYYMPISIIIPAYNEETVIVDSVKALLQLDYKLYEIIIVDDGSTDGTITQLLNNFPFHRIDSPVHRRVACKKESATYEASIKNIHLKVILKENGGKGDALNMGINAAKYPYFLTVDADSLLQNDSLEKIIQPFMMDETVIAVGGMVRVAQSVEMTNGHVSNYTMPWSPIIGMQVVEYDRTFLASRILLDQFSGNLIISGAFGLYKKDIVVEVGGYKRKTIGEDMELVMRLHTFMLNNRRPYKISYVPEAVCWSQAPGSLKDIAKQRRRWHIGLFQSLTSYPEMLLRFRYKPVSYVSYVYYWLFELIGPFIEVFGLLTLLLASHFNLLNVPFMIGLFLIYTVYGIILSMTAFFQRVYIQGHKLKALDIIKASVFVTLENAVYRYFLSVVRVFAFVGYKKNGGSWGSIKRSKHKIFSPD